MRANPKLLKIIFLLLITFSAFSQDYHVRIGFIGNSITIGSGLSNPVRDCYPSQLAVMLKEIYGDTCIITNYAVSGRTMLKQGDFPIGMNRLSGKCGIIPPTFVLFHWAPMIQNLITGMIMGRSFMTITKQ